ncbi:hypothetical protein E5161_08840 [Cohnella pontilimi]|uniref:Uncharacterized protein n=1 Tax=Cohnella pontilimi TaxID=2564100 RepID=A0A4U0FDV0_9BACL|nr:hypothetical protein [Cohnella pontilimi]TJY42928.1 hypothetical protein E5161_08840 [Cohnella pontilimi]
MQKGLQRKPFHPFCLLGDFAVFLQRGRNDEQGQVPAQRTLPAFHDRYLPSTEVLVPIITPITQINNIRHKIGWRFSNLIVV